MADYVNISAKNRDLSQHVTTITDLVLERIVLEAQPIAAGESVDVRLVADENGLGQMRYQFKG